MRKRESTPIAFRSYSGPHTQKGAALLIVLVLVGSLSVLALGLTQKMTRSIAQVQATQERDEAIWALLGAEVAALHLLEMQDNIRTNVDLASERWLAEPLLFPFGEGMIEARFKDRSDCFHINALVTDGGAQGIVTNANMIRRFGQMILDLGGDARTGEILASAAADFMDSDGQAGPGGAEDFTYSRVEVPYRTASQPLADISELRAAKGWGRQVYRLLAPYICVRPGSETAMGLVNVNTLTPEDAPLLRAVIGPEISLANLERMIEDRPPDGYANVQAFLGQPLFANRNPPLDATVAQALSTHAAYIEFSAQISYGDRLFKMTSMIEKAKGQRYQVVSRRLGGADL
ncbi:MAG: type II secretion system minor pseudopilin GspK [Pseudomonadota bacterium]